MAILLEKTHGRFNFTFVKLWDLYRGRDYSIAPTLERIRRAVDYTGGPQRAFPSVLVGGTNGKGSTCAFLERLLREQGFRTGWFVSPHLVSENERWRVNGEPVDDDTLSAYVRDLRAVMERFELTYFEAATLIALLYFRDSGVDVAVMEVGMGGRWDATKVSDPAVVGITNVERDHTRWLGRTVEEIAEDKLHLFVEGVPLVLGSPRYPLYTKALELNLSGLVVAGEDYTYGGEVRGHRTFLKDYRFADISLPSAELGLTGRWQADNAAMAITLARLFTRLDESRIPAALAETRWEGRMEILREKPLLVVDGSHNPYAVGRAVKEVSRLFGRDVGILFTGLAEKEWRLSMELIRRYRDTIYLIQINHHRGERITALYEHARELGFREIHLLRSAEEVWSVDVDLCALGSLYLIGEIKEARRHTVI